MYLHTRERRDVASKLYNNVILEACIFPVFNNSLLYS